MLISLVMPKNYLVARPDKGQHCENILLDQEYQLWNAYERDIILAQNVYSWLLRLADGCLGFLPQINLRKNCT